MTSAPLDPVGFHRRIPLLPHQLTDRVTRTEDVIVLCHLGVARLRPEDWSLEIGGLVQRPARLRLSDLKSMRKFEVASVHQCAGSPLAPTTPTRRICNVVWGGVRLAHILAGCSVLPGARFVWSSGADSGTFEGVECRPYVKDLPLERVAADVLVAYELNGEPLRPENGYPVRMVVPGFYGTNSVKWLTRIELADRRAEGPFTTRWYNDHVLDSAGESTGQTVPVWAIAPESVIVSPAPDSVLRAGVPIDVWGWAWADGGVKAVELSDDTDGQWRGALLEPARGRTWQRFQFTWLSEAPGRLSLRSRAHGCDGEVQPLSGARNAVHLVSVTVQ